MCDEIRLTLAEVRRRTPSAVPAWGPRGTTPRLTVRGTAAGAPPPPPPPPQAVRQCIAGVALPTAPRQWGSALQELHCPLPPGSGAVHCRSYAAHYPQAGGQCIAGVALPTAPRQWRSALQELHCLLPEDSEAVHSRSCTAHCPQAVRQCIAGVALSTAPKAMRQCIARVTLPTVPRQGVSALHELHCPLPPGSGAVHCKSCTAYCLRTVRQRIAGAALSTAPRQ